MKLIAQILTFFITVHCMDLLACEKEGPDAGYWFYNDCPEEELQEEEDKPHELGPLPKPSELMQMHPDKLAEILEQRKKHAVWKLTPDSVIDYYVVQDVVRRKALSFTALTKYVMMTNPELNANAQYPTVAPARKVATQMHEQMIAGALHNNRRNYALAIFTKKSCPYCPTQKSILQYFSDRHNWIIKEIDIEDAPNSALRFNVSVTPMTIIIERGTDRWMPVAVGVEALPNIENGVYRAIRMLKGEITPQQYILNEYDEGGFFDPTALQENM